MAAWLWWAGVVAPGSCAGRAPLAADDLMTGESAGPRGVLAPSLDVAQRCLCRLISLLASFYSFWVLYPELHYIYLVGPVLF